MGKGAELSIKATHRNVIADQHTVSRLGLVHCTRVAPVGISPVLIYQTWKDGRTAALAVCLLSALNKIRTLANRARWVQHSNAIYYTLPLCTRQLERQDIGSLQRDRVHKYYKNKMNCLLQICERK